MMPVSAVSTSSRTGRTRMGNLAESIHTINNHYQRAAPNCPRQSDFRTRNVNLHRRLQGTHHGVEQTFYFLDDEDHALPVMGFASMQLACITTGAFLAIFAGEMFHLRKRKTFSSINMHQRLPRLGRRLHSLLPKNDDLFFNLDLSGAVTFDVFATLYFQASF